METMDFLEAREIFFKAHESGLDPYTVISDIYGIPRHVVKITFLGFFGETTPERLSKILNKEK